MEALGVAQVAAWLRDELALPAYAAAAEEHTVDGEALLELLKTDGGLAALGVTSIIHRCRIQGAVNARQRRREAGAIQAPATGLGPAVDNVEGSSRKRARTAA